MESEEIIDLGFVSGEVHMLVLKDDEAFFADYDEDMMIEHISEGAVVVVGVDKERVKDFTCWPLTRD